MKITGIKQQVKRADRYSIFIDEKYVLSLSESELLNQQIRIGQELSDDELRSLKDNAIIDKAYDKALNLIFRRARSEWEISDYLKRNQYEFEVIESIVERLKERGYLHDLEFAKSWVDNRRLLKLTSKRKLTQELKQKRVSDEIIEQVLADDETDELEVLKDLVERKRKQTKYQDKIKLMQYLARQGFSYDLIKEAVSDQAA